MDKPVKTEHYNPIERPRRYPLELRDDGHICLWSENGEYKWTIALFNRHKEGYDLTFVGDRPLDPRVNWTHFREIIEQGQSMHDRMYRDEHGANG
jgi:hypothetical protein